MDEMEAWLARIRESDIPVLRHTAHTLAGAAADDDQHASALTTLILQDAGMTTTVLRLANSAFYNPMGTRMSTVSRAVFVLGFDEIRSMCLSVALIDTFLKGKPRKEVVNEMARAFHAATQARSLARARKDKDPEEVFVAALLYRLGNLVFWCNAGKTGEQLLREYKKPKTSRARAERNVLGFELSHLTRELAREWNLTEVLQDTLNGKGKSNARSKSVVVSHELAEAAEKGWNSVEMKKAMKETAELLKCSRKDVEEIVAKTAEEAMTTAKSFGARSAARRIPLPPDFKQEESKDSKDETRIEGGSQSEFLEPNPLLQLQILQELSALFVGDANFDSVVQMVLEGIYRGVGMDRVFFALLTPDRRFLEIRFAMGADSEELSHSFSVAVDPMSPNIFVDVLKSGEASLIKQGESAQRSARIPQNIFELVGDNGCYLAPVMVSGRTIGVFFADRSASAREMDETGFESFKHFVVQANLGLEHFTKSISAASAQSEKQSTI